MGWLLYLESCRCSVLQCVAVCCQCVAVCCSVLHCVAVFQMGCLFCVTSGFVRNKLAMHKKLQMQCVAVCRRVLQCVAMLYGVSVLCHVGVREKWVGCFA